MGLAVPALFLVSQLPGLTRILGDQVTTTGPADRPRPHEDARRYGVRTAGRGVFRLSVGLEDPADLMADLDNALEPLR